MTRSISKYACCLIVAFAALAVCSQRAAAQAPIPNACCTYTVDIAGFPASCLPVRLMTRWSGGIDFYTITANGVFVVPISGFPCPPIPAQFAWASLDAGVTLAWYNFPAFYHINGCCFIVRLSPDQNGCIYITIRPC